MVSGINPLHSSVVAEKDNVVLQTKTSSNIGSKTKTSPNIGSNIKLQLMLVMALFGLFHGKIIAMCVAPCCILLISMCSKLFYKKIGVAFIYIMKYDFKEGTIM